MGGIGTAAVLASAVIGAGSAAYQADQQKKAAEEDARKREEERLAEQARIDKINADTKPDGVALDATVSYGVQNDKQSTSSFLVDAPTQKTLGGASGISGLGFKV